jgi:hypothetical protein
VSDREKKIEHIFLDVAFLGVATAAVLLFGAMIMVLGWLLAHGWARRSSIQLARRQEFPRSGEYSCNASDHSVLKAPQTVDADSFVQPIHSRKAPE